jgi:hypothetical protein
VIRDREQQEDREALLDPQRDFQAGAQQSRHLAQHEGQRYRREQVGSRPLARRPAAGASQA